MITPKFGQKKKLNKILEPNLHVITFACHFPVIRQCRFAVRFDTYTRPVSVALKI